jgi:hypothetical protein
MCSVPLSTSIWSEQEINISSCGVSQMLNWIFGELIMLSIHQSISIHPEVSCVSNNFSNSWRVDILNTQIPFKE